MKDQAHSANAMTELRPETRQFLAKLEPSDLRALEAGVTLVRRVENFGFVLKWLAIAAIAVVAGVVTFGEGIQKIASWFKTPS